MSEEYEKNVEEAIQLLEQIKEDTSIPKNIRRAAAEALDYLLTDDPEMTLPVKANNAISILNETTMDPNCPLHARTKIYYIIARLEPPAEE